MSFCSLALASLRINLQTIGFGPIREVSRKDTLWAISISRIETSAPILLNKLTQRLLVSSALVIQYSGWKQHKTFLYREFTIRRDCSVSSFCCYAVCRAIRGFEQKLSKNHILIHFPKSPPSNFWILPSAKLTVPTVNVWVNTSRKRPQNHFRLHFTSKTPYKFDTCGILSTPAWRCLCTTENNNQQSDKHDKKESWQTIQTRNIIQWNI